MTDEELCGALTPKFVNHILQWGWTTDEGAESRNLRAVVRLRPTAGDSNSVMVRFRVRNGYLDPQVCIWASDRHLHVFVNGACVLWANAGESHLEQSPNARELWNAVRGIQAGGAMPDAARARQQLVEALSGGAA